MSAITADSFPEQITLQRRVIGVLSAAQILGGVGVASGAAVGSLLAKDLSSESFAGF